eukprot:Em0028g57a
MDTIPQGLSGVVYYQDDVLVTGLKGLEMVKNPDQPSEILCRVGLPWELVRATGDQVTEARDQDPGEPSRMGCHGPGACPQTAPLLREAKPMDRANGGEPSDVVAGQVVIRGLRPVRVNRRVKEVPAVERMDPPLHLFFYFYQDASQNCRPA